MRHDEKPPNGFEQELKLDVVKPITLRITVAHLFHMLVFVITVTLAVAAIVRNIKDSMIDQSIKITQLADRQSGLEQQIRTLTQQMQVASRERQRAGLGADELSRIDR